MAREESPLKKMLKPLLDRIDSFDDDIDSLKRKMLEFDAEKKQDVELHDSIFFMIDKLEKEIQILTDQNTSLRGKLESLENPTTGYLI